MSRAWRNHLDLTAGECWPHGLRPRSTGHERRLPEPDPFLAPRRRRPARRPGPASRLSSALADTHREPPPSMRCCGRPVDLGPADHTRLTSPFRTVLFTDLKGSTSLLAEVGPGGVHGPAHRARPDHPACPGRLARTRGEAHGGRDHGLVRRCGAGHRLCRSHPGGLRRAQRRERSARAPGPIGLAAGEPVDPTTTCSVRR